MRKVVAFTTNSTNTKRMIEYFEKYYANEFNNLDYLIP